MSEPSTPADGREIDHMDAVDAHPDAGRATETDEQDVLRRLHGAPDDHGIYRGERADREEG